MSVLTRIAAGSAVVAAAALLLLPAITAPVTAAESCKRDVTAQGRQVRGENNARSVAIGAWQSKVSRQYGRRFADYYYSGDRTMSCVWDSRGVLYTCRVTALPCG
jgi:hypothetical protein